MRCKLGKTLQNSVKLGQSQSSAANIGCVAGWVKKQSEKSSRVIGESSRWGTEWLATGNQWETADRSAQSLSALFFPPKEIVSIREGEGQCAETWGARNKHGITRTAAANQADRREAPWRPTGYLPKFGRRCAVPAKIRLASTESANR